MKYIFYCIIYLLSITLCSAQINEKDSIVYVKNFWNKDDIKRYKFSTKEIKRVQNKIEQEEDISYKVTIKVEDIFEDEKTMSWTYDDVKFNSDKFINNPLSLLKQIQIKFIVDADGRFVRYVDLNNTINSFVISAEKVQNEHLDDSEILKQINGLVKQYSNEEKIVNIFEKDIKQFHLFFGTGEFKPKANQLEFNSYMDNLFSTSPTPATTTIQLNDIALSGTNYIMNSFQEADKDWLVNSWFNYLKLLAEKLKTEQPDESHKSDDIIYNVKTNSRINDNGWLSFSKEVKKVQFQDTDYTLERRIELE